MGIIPLEKLIEYKGNRYELSRAMIELAKTGSALLKAETKYRQGKYIPTVMKNILDGNIKYEYIDDTLKIDEEAPFNKYDNISYDVSEYAAEIEEVEEENIDTIVEEDYSDEDFDDEDFNEDFDDEEEDSEN